MVMEIIFVKSDGISHAHRDVIGPTLGIKSKANPSTFVSKF